MPIFYCWETLAMNVLFLSTRSPYPLISGHSLRTYHILRGVAEYHDTTLITFAQLESELKKENLDHLRSFCRAVYPFRIPVDTSRMKLSALLAFNLLTPRPFVAQKYDVPIVRHKIRQIVDRDRIHLVHVDMLPLSVYINEFQHLPKILVNHNVESIRLYRWFRTESNVFKKVYLAIQWLKLRAHEQIRQLCCSIGDGQTNLSEDGNQKKSVRRTKWDRYRVFHTCN